jgi:hypothetical protein
MVEIYDETAIGKAAEAVVRAERQWSYRDL